MRRLVDPRAVVGIVSGGHLLSHFYLLAFPPLFPDLRRAFGLDAVGLGLVVSVVAIGTFLQVPAGGLVARIGAAGIAYAAVAWLALAPVHRPDPVPAAGDRPTRLARARALLGPELPVLALF